MCTFAADIQILIKSKQTMKRHLLVLGLSLLCLGTMADDVQTVTIGGSTVDKTVKQITFDGDNVILHYADNSTDTQDMAVEVKIAFDLSTAIEYLGVETARDTKIYNLRGQYMGDNLQDLPVGVYIQSGKKVIVK